MSQQQFASPGTEVDVLVTVVDANGDAVAAVIDTTTTRLTSHLASVPTVSQIETGVDGNYKVSFTGLNPALAAGDVIFCRVNGAVSGTPWTEYAVRIDVQPTQLIERGNSYRWTNDNSGAGFDEVTVNDVP